VAAAGCNPVVLRSEQLNDQAIGFILQETETGLHPEWKDIADRSHTNKSYRAQLKSQVVTNRIIKRHRKATDGWSKIAQIVLPQRRVNEVLTELHVGQSGGHLGVNKTLNKVQQRYYWLQARNDVENWCRQSTPVQPVVAPEQELGPNTSV
jgi:hypothetical protein